MSQPVSLIQRVALIGALVGASLVAGCLGPPSYANPRRTGGAPPAEGGGGATTPEGGGDLEAVSPAGTPSPASVEETVEALGRLCVELAAPGKFATDVDATTYPADGSRPVKLFVRSGSECRLLVVRSGPEGLLCLTRDHRDYEFGTRLWSGNSVTIEAGGQPGVYRLFVYALLSSAAGPEHGESLAVRGMEPGAPSAFYARLADAMKAQGIAASEARYTVE